MQVNLSHDEIKAIRCALWFVLEADRRQGTDTDLSMQLHLFERLREAQKASTCSSGDGRDTYAKGLCQACYKRDRRNPRFL